MRSQTLRLTVSIFLFISSLAGYSYGEIISADRRINWSPGIPGGIPNRTTICANVKNAPYNAKGDDVTDDTTAIQNAINGCPEGQVVYIPSGTYRITNTINIGRGIVLRGDGPSTTRLKFYRTGSGTANINIGLSGGGSGSQFNVLSGYTKGSTSMTLSSVSGLSSGALVYITQDNDGNFVTNVGSGGTCTWCGDNGKGLGQMLVLTNVNSSTNTITFEPNLYWTYSANLNPYIKEIPNPVRYGGIEDLYINNVNEAALINIRLTGCIYCWVKNIESYKGQRHIEIDWSYRSEVRDSYIHHHHVYVPNHYSVLLGSFATANLVENNIFYYTKGGTIMAAWGAAGNVIAYNYSWYAIYTGTNYLQQDITHHGAHPMMNLWEGNIVQMLGADSYWGSISHNTFFRNYVRREKGIESIGLYNRFVVTLEAKTPYHNFIGNVLGYSGAVGQYEVENQTCTSSTAGIYKLGYNGTSDCDPSGNDANVRNTLYRHGNYDYITQSTIWDANNPDRNIPNSLYLTSKPAFFGNLPWPAIGPDLNPMVGAIPAMERFNSGGVGDIQTPTTPTGLSAQAVSSSQINLTWAASTDDVGVTGYRIYRDSIEIATSTTTSYSNTGLSPSTTYSYTVSAYDATGNNSAQSSSASATTSGGGGGTGSNDASASGGSGCGYLKDNNGKGQGAKGEGLSVILFFLLLILLRLRRHYKYFFDLA